MDNQVAYNRVAQKELKIKKLIVGLVYESSSSSSMFGPKKQYFLFFLQSSFTYHLLPHLHLQGRFRQETTYSPLHPNNID
jgi:hypothetical protein